MLLAVTKGFGVDAVTAAAAAGIASIGENYAQELLSKLQAARTAGLDVHFIGRLQSNKVRQLAGAVVRVGEHRPLVARRRVGPPSAGGEDVGPGCGDG